MFYFVNYALSPIFNAIGTSIYHMTTTQVSLHIVWAFVVAAVVGTCSGMIIGKIGIKAGLVTAGTLMFVGWTGAAFCVNSGFVVLRVLRRLRHDVFPGRLHRAGHHREG